MLLRKFSYCSPDVKCCMFKSYCSTMYCSSMWFDSTVTSMRKLKLLTTTVYNSTSERFVNSNIPSSNELLRKFVYSFKGRIQDSCNSLVNGIVKSSVPLFSRKWAWAPAGGGGRKRGHLPPPLEIQKYGAPPKDNLTGYALKF